MSPEQKLFERAFEIIEAYGAEPTRWPDGERDEIERFVETNPELQRHLQVHAEVDRRLSQLTMRPRLNPQVIAQQIALQPQGISTLQRVQLQFERLAESMTAAFWKPVMAASFIFVVGVGAGSVALEPVEDWTQAEQMSFVVIGEE